MAATAPIPPNGDAPLGAAEGHDEDYGRFLVATGPYQFLGSENMDFSVPADEQTPVAGYEPGKSIQLVRNPNYDPATDGLRPAYPDGFNISIGGDNNDLYNKVQAGELDVVVDGIVPPPVLRTYSTDPTLQTAAAHQPVGRRSVHLVQPGCATVRRHPHPQGGQLRVGQGRDADVPRW